MKSTVALALLLSVVSCVPIAFADECKDSTADTGQSFSFNASGKKLIAKIAKNEGSGLRRLVICSKEDSSKVFSFGEGDNPISLFGYDSFGGDIISIWDTGSAIRVVVVSNEDDKGYRVILDDAGKFYPEFLSITNVGISILVSHVTGALSKDDSATTSIYVRCSGTFKKFDGILRKERFAWLQKSNGEDLCR